MRHKQSGFTLIELVVVIVILGILAATALPKLQTIDMDAKRAATAGSLAALTSAAQISYSTSKSSSKLMSIWANSTFSDQLFSIRPMVCDTTSNSATTITGVYYTQGADGALTSLASVDLDTTLCSA